MEYHEERYELKISGMDENILRRLFLFLYDLTHEVKIEVNKNYKSAAIKKVLMQQAWDILMNITEHTADWIVETKKWSKLELAQNLEA